MEPDIKSPIFVVGPLRSGTTLLRLLLDHHPDLYFFDEFEGAVSEANGDEWPDINEYHHFSRNDRMMQALNLKIDTDLNYEDLVHSYLNQIASRSSKPFVGASVHSRIDLLHKLWPEAKFIHLLRDPRDVARSAIGMGWVGNVYHGTQYWIEPEIHWDKLKSKVPSQQLIEVRYEELVENPREELTLICNFIGVEYSDDMLKLEKDTTYSAPDPKYSYQWKKKLTPKQVSWVECQAAELMGKRGYALSGGSLQSPTAIEKIKLNVQNRFSRVQFNVARWGFSLWVQHVISKHLKLKSWHTSVQHRINNIVIQHLK